MEKNSPQNDVLLLRDPLGTPIAGVTTDGAVVDLASQIKGASLLVASSGSLVAVLLPNGRAASLDEAQQRHLQRGGVLCASLACSHVQARNWFKVWQSKS